MGLVAVVTLGIIARCDDRGIASQTLSYCEALDPERVLLVMTGDLRFPEYPERFKRWNCTQVQLASPGRNRPPTINEQTVCRWIDGLDTVFAVETLYEWRMANWAQRLGARTVVHGNPEMTRHGTPAQRELNLHNPDMWMWPTPWLHCRLPPGPIIPVACERRPQVAADPNDPVLRVLHVAGKRAIGDRNGTEVVMDNIPWLRGRIHVTVIGQDGQLPAIPKETRSGITFDLIPEGVEDRWSMYDNQHVLLLPRRYGGLCLPALEAMACGLGLVMSDCAPNDLWPIEPIPCVGAGTQRVPAGEVPVVTFKFRETAQVINELADDRKRLASLMQSSREFAARNTWDRWAPIYRKVLS